MKTRLMAALACVAMLATPAVAQDHTGWLADNANMLGEQERQSIQSAIETVYQATGTRVCVRTISSSNGDDVKHIAVQTLNAWNPGPRSVMILVCLEPRMIYLQPGTNLKFVFEGDTATGICRNTIAPHFKAGNHANGILAGIQAVQTRLMSPAAVTPVQYQPAEPATFLGLTAKTWFWIIVVALVIIFLIWLASRSDGYSSGYGGGSNWFFFSSSGGSDSSSSSSWGDSGGSSWGGGGSCDGGGGGGSSW